MRVGILTGGGDCPGLNAVIRAIVRKGETVHEDELIGFLDAWDGVREGRFMPLDVGSLRGMLPRGGTLLGTRRGSPYDHEGGPEAVVESFAQLGLDALVVIGGNGSLSVACNLHEDFGLNVILPVMPLHGPRARDLPRGKAIPGEEVLDDVHFAAQAVWDVRRVLSWIRRQEPAAPIGLNAISLGGYVSSLVASLDPHLTCAILGVPVADLISLLGRHSGFAPGDPRYQTLQDAAPLAAMVTPLSLEPKVPPKGRFIYGGVADRVVHPRDQVVKLWEHWGKPEIVWYRGGHAGFFTARPVRKFVDAALVQSGLVGTR